MEVLKVKMDVAQFNAIILESKLELTMMLMSLKDGENIETRMINLIETLEELPYK